MIFKRKKKIPWSLLKCFSYTLKFIRFFIFQTAFSFDFHPKVWHTPISIAKSRTYSCCSRSRHHRRHLQHVEFEYLWHLIFISLPVFFLFASIASMFSQKKFFLKTISTKVAFVYPDGPISELKMSSTWAPLWDRRDMNKLKKLWFYFLVFVFFVELEQN